jgi:acyl-coenzyme A synthetase/AMP-(fatty) acid ligase
MASSLNAFPDNSLFRRVFLVSESCSDGLIVDSHNGSINYTQLLHDVRHYRNELRQFLSPSLFTDTGIMKEDDMYICTVMKSSYEMIVAFFSILSIGAAMIPLCK